MLNRISSKCCWQKSLFDIQIYKNNRIEKLPSINHNENICIDFDQKCNAFIDVMFSLSPNVQKNTTDHFITYEFSIEKWMPSWPILIEWKLSSAFFTSAFKKSLKSNNLIFLIIQKAYKIISKLFFMIFSCLINNEIHSNCWRTNIDAILKKFEKSNYFISKLYRIIILLNCLKKISKKIIVKRLLYLKQMSNMLDFDQIEKRKNRSTIDAILNLTHDIQLILKQKLITLCLFLDVKEAFNHVSTNQLLIILIK